jgi:hypothetical protein
MDMAIKGWMKPKSAAEYADVSEESIREWMRTGLPHAPVSDRITLIRIEDIDKFIATRLRTRNDVDSAVDEVVSSVLKSIQGGKNGRNREGKTSRIG